MNNKFKRLFYVLLLIFLFCSPNDDQKNTSEKSNNKKESSVNLPEKPVNLSIFYAKDISKGKYKNLAYPKCIDTWLVGTEKDVTNSVNKLKEIVILFGGKIINSCKEEYIIKSFFIDFAPFYSFPCVPLYF